MYRFLKHSLVAIAALLLLTTLAAGLPAAAGADAAAETAASPAALPAASLSAPAAAVTADLPAPTVTLVCEPDSVRSGRRATLTAQVDVPGAALAVSRRRAGETEFTAVTTLTADDSGRASWDVRLSVSTAYRVEFAGDAAWAPAAAEATASVRPNITVALKARELTFRRDPVTVKVQVGPAHPGAAIELQQWDAKTKAWTTVKSLTLGDDSRASTVVRPEIGKLKLRAFMAADAQHVDGHSAVQRLRVLDPRNPYGIPTGPAHFIVVDLSQYKLYYHEHGIVVRAFSCVLGRPGLPTPRGHFKIYAKDPNMGGPYGPRRMRYNGLFAIHGTNEPWLLGRWPRNYSHGCTRLSNTNIVWLFARCRVGTPVWNVP